MAGLLTLLPAVLRAQQVAITFNIIPPYSAYVYDYADLGGQAVITLTNTTPNSLDVRLEGSFTNLQNGLFVRTEAGHRGPVPITLPPMGTVVLSNQPGLMDFLDPQYVQTNAPPEMEQAIMQTGQLPEGVYQFCVAAYDHNGPQMLSAPTAGCTSINIQYALPPIITQPVNGAVVPGQMKNPVFSWTPPLGNLAGAMVAYDLLVTTMFPGQDPNDAIIAARTYQVGLPILLKEGLMNTVYVRQPGDLAFTPGKQYAVQVTARDLNGQVGISNQGRSEVHVFSVGPGLVAPVGQQPMAPVMPPVQDPWIGEEFVNSNLHGRLRYYWPTPGTYTDPGAGPPANAQMEQVQGPGGNGNPWANLQMGQQGGGNGNPFGNMQVGPVQPPGNNNTPALPGIGFAEMGGLVLGNRAGYDAFQQSPLAGVTVQLVQAVQLKGSVQLGAGVDPKLLLPGNVLVVGNGVYTTPGNFVSMPVLATTTTGANGSFSFNVPGLHAIDFGWKDGSVNVNDTYGEFTGKVTCDGWRRVLMVRIGTAAHQYYAQPAQFNAGIPEDNDLGLFHARVRTFGVRVLVTEQYDKSQVKNNAEVLLMRRKGTRPAMVPTDELSPGQHHVQPELLTVGGNQYEVLAKGITNASGEVDFHHLVRFDEFSNKYYTHVRPVDDFHTQWSFFNHVRKVPYAYPYSWTCKGPDYSYVHPDCAPAPPLGLASHGDGSHSTLDDTHPAGYHTGPTWLYNMSFVSKMRPQVSATVKNSAAGVQGDMALNEPGVGWALWRVDEQAMAFMRETFTGKKWGLGIQGSPADGFNFIQAALQYQGFPMQLARFGSTGADGRVHEKELWSNGTQNNVFSPVMFYVLTLGKTGFSPIVHTVFRQETVNQQTGDVGALEWGYNYNEGELWMQPKGEVAVDLWNENGEAVTGKAYYYDPATGQQGVITGSQPIQAPGGGVSQRVFLNVPSGNGRKIVVVPTDLDLYDRDTITVDVPAEGGLLVDATIPFKLHRIHFHIAPAVAPFNEPDPRIAGARVELINSNAVMYPGIAHPETEFEGALAASLDGPPENFGGFQQQGGGFQQQGGDAPPLLLPVHVRHANAARAVDFAFRSSATEFTFRVHSPDDQEYITREVVVTSTPGKHWQVKTVEMELGRKVRGKVMLDSAAVAGARVTTSYGSMVNEVFTNADGWYEMRRVPKDTMLTFMASKGGCNCVGMEYTEGQQQGFGLMGQVFYSAMLQAVDDPHTRIDFKLKIYGDLDFHRLNGFPIEVTNLTEMPGAQVRINGWLTVPDSANTVFRLTEAGSEGNKLDIVRFMETVVEPSALVNEIGIPLAKPVVDPMPLAVNDVAVGMYPKGAPGTYVYHTVLHDMQQGITVGRPGDGPRGAVQGRVKVSVGSFTDNGLALDAAEHFALMDPAQQGQLRLNTFGSDAASFHPDGTGFRVGALNGQPLGYVLHGFQASSIPATSRLYRDSLVLDTRLHTELEHVPAPQNDLDVHIGKVRTANGQLVPLQVQSDFSIPLGQFQFAGTHLSMGSGGVGLKGTLHANGMDLPVEDGILQPTTFLLGQLPVEGMKLIGAVPVSAHRPAIFGYDAVRPEPAWYVAVTSGDHHVAGAEISGEHLDGIPDDRHVPLTSVWLYSNGDQETSLAQDMQPYPLFDVVSVSLQGLVLSPDLLVLTTGLETGIPQFPVYTTALVYDKQGDALGPMQLQPFSMAPLNFNGIQLAFDRPDMKALYNVAGSSASIRFEPGRMTITGGISDENPTVFKELAYTLEKTPAHTRLTVDRDPQQSVRLGGDNPGSRIVMADVEGEMRVEQGQWGHFHIKGDMPQEMGFRPGPDGAPQRMRFEVLGDLQVQDQEVHLTDFESPFGHIHMVYDAQHHRLAGQVNMGGSAGNGPSMNGTAAMVIDRDGYYFMSGLNVQMPDPEMQGMAFVLLGDYATRTPQMDALLVQYSLYSQRLIERRSSPAMLNMVLQMLASNAEAGMAMAQSAAQQQVLPATYTGLFGSGRFNGFYFACGASIPFPLLPNFSIDCSPIAEVGFGVNMGADVRFGSNFGTGSAGVGFDVFMDAEMGGGGSMGLFCFHGRIGAYFTMGMDGVFHGDGSWDVNAYGDMTLAGGFNIGGGICSVPCDDWSCLHVSVEGSIGMGIIGEFSNNGSDFRIELGADGTNSSTHEPPPPESEN
ncbi:MAG: hypothetical protein RBT71_04140 [Flavobacteriales bacterium]|nr:hypothetical protein [Flavobacteriales bacterium]